MQVFWFLSKYPPLVRFAIANERPKENPRFRGIRGFPELDLLKHIGEKIRSQILRNGYASIELYAHENDIPKSTLSEIITGKHDPRLSTLAKICAGLDLTLSELFRDPELDTWVREKAAKYGARRSSSGPKGPKSGGGRKS